MIAESLIKTENASKYIKWLCSHFNIKTQAEWDDTQGQIHFPFGECLMQARPEAVFVQIETEDAEDFARLKFVVGDHIERFAKKDAVQVTWVDQPSTQKEQS